MDLEKIVIYQAQTEKKRSKAGTRGLFFSLSIEVKIVIKSGQEIRHRKIRRKEYDFACIFRENILELWKGYFSKECRS